MAIDMTTVKQIMHNNKEVVKIEDGLGKVLWQKVTGPEWHTLWSGSAYAKVYTTSNNGYWKSSISDTNVLATIPIEAMGSGCQLRITWSYSGGRYPSSSSRYYLKNNSIFHSSPENPYVIDTSSLGKNTDGRLLGLVANGSSDTRYQGKVYLKGNSNTRELRLDTAYNGAQNIGENYSAQFTVTKIELYYIDSGCTIYTDEKHYIMGTDTSYLANYFDLGYPGKNTFRIEGKLWYNFGDVWRRLIGIGDKNSNNWESSLQIVSGNATSCSAIINGSNIGINNCLKNNSWNGFSMGQRGDSKFSFWTKNQDHDGREYYKGNMQSQIANTNLMLFEGYENSSDTTGQVSHLQVCDAANTNTWPDILIHEYWPAIRNIDKQVGLWDSVTNTFIEPIINGNGSIVIKEHST